MTKVTMKDTKQTIFDQLKEAQKQLREAKKATLNPAEEKQARRKADVVSKTAGLTPQTVGDQISALRNTFQTSLSEMEQKLKDEAERLQLAQESLAFKQAEVKEIYDIEHEAETLAALIQAQNERRLEFEADLKIKKDTFAEEMETKRKDWALQVAEHKRQHDLQVQLDNEKRERDLEQVKYEAQRQERERIDTLQDQLNSRTKTFEAKVEQMSKELAERTEQVIKREQTMDELQARVAQLETDIVTQVEAAKSETRDSMNKSNAIAQSAMKRGYEAEVTVLNGRVDSLTSQLEASQRRVETLESDLSQARAEVNSVALRALDAQSGARALEAVTAATQQNGRDGKR